MVKNYWHQFVSNYKRQPGLGLRLLKIAIVSTWGDQRNWANYHLVRERRRQRIR